MKLQKLKNKEPEGFFKGENGEQAICRNIVKIILDHLAPKKIILFGSRADGKGKEYSDFDIAVEGIEMNIREERLLKEALDRKLGIYTIDLINLDKVDKEFKTLVVSKGKVIYER